MVKSFFIKGYSFFYMSPQQICQFPYILSAASKLYQGHTLVAELHGIMDSNLQ